MPESAHPALRAALAALAGPNPRLRFLRVETVVILDDGAIAWDGEVHVFGIDLHPRATIGYAWMGDDGRAVAVLGESGIATASDAVERRRAGPRP